MALGNNTGYSGGPLIFLSARSKDKKGNKVSPHFTVGRVGEDKKIVQTDETVTSVSGDLIKVEVGEREIKGNVNKHAVLFVRDRSANEGKGETYHLGLTFSIPARGLFNSLASLTEKSDFKNLQIDIYENQKGYETFALKQNGEKTSWKYKLDELPEAIEIKHPKTGKVEKRDYSEVDEFFEKELLAIAAKVGGGKKEDKNEKSGTENSAPQQNPSSKPATKEENLDEDIPF